MKIPFYKQDTEYTCGPASLQMVLSFLGDFKSEFELARRAKTSKETGTSHGGMIETAKREGFFVYVNSDSSAEEIKYFLGLGHPVIVDFLEPSSNIGHYGVATAIKKGGLFFRETICLNDPWNGGDFKILLNEFEKRWRDPLTKSKCWLMVVSKEDFNLGKQYLPL